MFPDTIEHKDAHVWATMIPDRHPEFKVHKTEGLANAALGGRDVNERFAKYELVGDTWIKRFEYEPPSRCDRCDADFVDVRRWRNSGRNRQKYNYSGPKFMAPVICDKCSYEDAEERRAAASEAAERKALAILKAKYEN